MTWVQTYTRQQVNLLHPDPSAIKLEDIAHALSHLCRFGGHTRTFYSVAEHACYVGRLAGVYGLHHDDAEYVLQDIVRPLKRAPKMEAYSVLYESPMQHAVLQSLGLFQPVPEIAEDVVLADNLVLELELFDVNVMGGPVQTWAGFPLMSADERAKLSVAIGYTSTHLNPRAAKAAFLQEHLDLMKPNHFITPAFAELRDRWAKVNAE